MGRAAAKQVEPVNVQLTIVPTDADEVDPPTAEDLLKAAPLPARVQSVRVPKVAAPAPTPAPAPRRTGLLVASALGGGVVIGGGAVGVLALIGGAVLAAGGVAAWLLAAAPVEPPPVAEPAPVVVEAPAAEPVVEAPAAEAPAAPEAPAKTPSASAPSKPAQPTPPASGTPSAPAAPVASAPAAAPLPDHVVVKIITDPPAARVIVDGEDMGRSPAKLELEPGSHQLTLESGRVAGSFPFDAGIDASKLCFAVQGKKLAQVACD